MNIKTDRLLIRPIKIEDKELIFEYRSDSITNKYQGWIPNSINDVVEFIKKSAPGVNIPDTWFQFVILQNETNTLIGDIGIHFLDMENKQAEIGCTLNKNFQGEGYATEALKGIIKYLFYDLQKHRIVTSIDPENISSIKLVERLGFRKEAHFVESLFLNGKWVDDIVYAILEKEWKDA